MPPPSPPSDAEIVGGLLERGLDVAYQPIVDLATDRVVGWEALLRGQLPVHGTVSPEAVVGSATRIGALDRVMRQVAEQALTTASVASLREGHRFLVSVNLEPAQVRPDSTFLHWLVARTARGPADLVLEITERGDAECWSEDQDAAIDALSAAGLRLAIDDLGAGASRLHLLARHDWSWVKLDRSFLTPGPRSEILLRHTVAMLHDLGAAVVVEGVETEADLALARTLGADLAQGRLLGVPVPVDVLLGTLSQLSSRAAD